MFTITPSPEPLIDIGANLTHQSFVDDIEQTAARAQQANVCHMMVTGSDLTESQAALKLALRWPQLFSATAGIHPHYADQCSDSTLLQLGELIREPAVRAVGETGLDYFRDISPRDVQQGSFVAHLQLAKEHAKPLFLHQRDAHDDFIAILREHRSSLGKIVVHCFTDTRAALRDYLDIDCHIGITGWICDERRGSHLLESVTDIPLDRLMIETDSPYLLPRSIRPKPKTRRNEPCTLPEVLATIANARAESLSQIATATTATARDFFNLPGHTIINESQTTLNQH